MNFEEIKLYLPQYLSPEDQKELFTNLKRFPESIDQKKFYSNFSNGDSQIYQGDLIKDFKICDIFREEFKKRIVCILSNTCDISTDNKRYFPTKIVYGPIISFKKYYKHFLQKPIERGLIKQNAVDNHIKDLKNQYITQLFYLPQGFGLDDEYILFLDYLHSYPLEAVDPNHISSKRITSLSNFGFYIFLFKLSVHFTRIREKVDRSN